MYQTLTRGQKEYNNITVSNLIRMSSSESPCKTETTIFFKKMWAEREDMLDDPFSHVMHLMRNSNTSTARYITNLIGSDMDDVSQAMNLLHQEVTNSQSSRCTYYKEINPHLSVHDIYSTKCIVNENERISWSKLRLSAHSLVIETGRWNRRGRGRLPIEERLCQCGQVQTERHVF